MARQRVTTSSLLDRARREGNPVIDGEKVTFVWQGRSAPRLICDLYAWEENPQALGRAGAGLWSLTLNLPRDAYLEYAFLDPKTKRHVPDPLNPHSHSNGLGGHNHFFYMPETAPSRLTRREPGVPHGTLTRHRVEADGMTINAQRSITLYHPPVSGPVPLLVVFDGGEYRSLGRLPVIVDNLIARRIIRPIALALLQNGAGRARTIEYACSDATLVFLIGSVLPLARAHLNLVDLDRNPGAYGVLGASLGGLMALFAALRLPQVFGRALSQSGAFQLRELETVVMQLVRTGPRADIRIFMDVGRFEDLLDGNRRLHALLLEKHYDVAYHEYNGAHNYTSWRDDLGRGLERLFA
jgi:enterochelin esterase-like enzyme